MSRRVLTDYHVHLRPDDEGTPAPEYFTAANADRYRTVAEERGIAELGVAEHIHRFSQSLEIWQHPWWQRWARDDVDAYCGFVREETDLRLGIAADAQPDIVRRIFRFVWRDGRLGDLPIEWAELMTELDVPDAAVRIASPEVKDALRRNTDQAIARGVFGVPTLAIGEQLFWGADATAMAADYVAQGCRFTDPEMARIADLPMGVERDAGKRK